MPCNNTAEFVGAVCEQIRSKKTHAEIARELTDHINDQKETYLAQGCDETTAEKQAVESMGDAVTVGQQLDRAHRPKTQWGVLSAVLVLLCAGLAIQYVLQINNVDTFNYVLQKNNINSFMDNIFLHYVKWLPMGIACLLLAYFADYTILGRHPNVIYLALTAVFLFWAGISGNVLEGRFNGRLSYFSWIVLLFVPAFAALVYDRRGTGYKGILVCGAAFLAPAFICLLIPNTMAFSLLFVACLIVWTVAILKGWFGGNRAAQLSLVYGGLVLAALLIWLFVLPGYTKERLLTVLQPDLDPMGSGWLVLQLKIMLGGVQFWGPSATLAGAFQGARIPNWWSDYMLAFFIGQYGYFIGILAAAAIGFLLFSMLRAALSLKNRLGFLVAFSCTVILAIECVQYFLVNFGVTAFGTLGLPLLTYGATGLCVHLFLIGLMLSTYRNDGLVWEHGNKKEPAHERVFAMQDGKLTVDFRAMAKYR